MAQFSNVIIHGSTIKSRRGDVNINTRDLEVGLHTLRLASSLGAIHDSAERCPPPNCHPDTRKAVRQIILDWIHTDSASPFFWLYGAPGVGKTAILQAIAEFLCSPSGNNGIFGGSFFFSRGKSGRDQGHFLFLTLAYQLALKVPGLRRYVNRIMEGSPELHTKSMAVQLQSLIVESFRCLSPLPQRSYLVIIDGLDECRDKATQQSVLQLLCETITAHKLPLRFLIGSRPESHIRDSFDQECLYTITRRVVLDKRFDPGRDIEVFLRDGFAKICAKNLSHVKQPWPDQGIIDLLVQRSSGQFIYAATVLKFVGADFCSPTKQLGLILKPDPSAFSDLDNLYTQILSVYPTTVDIVRVLGIIIAFDERTLTPEVIEDILRMEEGELKLVLRGLSSVIAFVGDDDGEYLTGNVISNVGRPYFSHASFADYLVDSSRSGPFYIDKQTYKHKATIWSFSSITTSIRESGRISSTMQVPHRATWRYFKSYLPAHFMSCPKVVKDAITTDINDVMQQFWRTSTDGVDIFSPAMCRLREILQILLDRWNHPVWDFGENHPIIEKFFDQLFSKSRYLDNVIKFLPGIVVQKSLTMHGMTELYGVTLDVLEDLISIVDPPTQFEVFPRSHLKFVLKDQLSYFLRDRERSHQCYCDPMLHHISICRHFLSLLNRSNTSANLRCYNELFEYALHNFYDHLCAATEVFLTGQKIPSDHPAVGILNDLESTTYYYVDPALPSQSFKFVRWIIHPILKWADMLNSRLKGTAVSISNVDLIERVRLSTNKIYREILCIKRHENTIVTLNEPGRFDFSAYSRRPQYRMLLSWDLLVWISIEGRIPSSFTHFITTPGLSGPLYISPDDYHTQITEYSLEAIFQGYNNSRPSRFSFYGGALRFPDWSFGEHLSRALPTEMIFYLLESIDLQRPQLHDYSPRSMLDLLEIIIKWLEGLGSDRPSDLYKRFLDRLELLHLFLAFRKEQRG